MSKFWKHWKWAVFLLLLISGFLVAVAVPNFVKARTNHCELSCVANLIQIDGAIQQWALENKKLVADAPDMAGVTAYLKGGVLPKCLEGGTYLLGATVADRPTCSKGAVAGHIWNAGYRQ